MIDLEDRAALRAAIKRLSAASALDIAALCIQRASNASAEEARRDHRPRYWRKPYVRFDGVKIAGCWCGGDRP